MSRPVYEVPGTSWKYSPVPVELLDEYAAGNVCLGPEATRDEISSPEQDVMDMAREVLRLRELNHSLVTIQGIFLPTTPEAP